MKGPAAIDVVIHVTFTFFVLRNQASELAAPNWTLIVGEFVTGSRSWIDGQLSDKPSLDLYLFYIGFI